MSDSTDRLMRRIRRLARLAAELQDLATDLSVELAVVRRTLSSDVSGRLEAAVERGLRHRAEADRRETLRVAAVGAWTLELRPQSRGAALVRLDEGKWFRLSRGDARLLRVLTMPPVSDIDGFPTWRTYEQVTEEMGRKSGTSPTRRAIVESVFRIRRAMKSADLNPYVLQVDRKLRRLRFLLRAPKRDAGAA